MLYKIRQIILNFLNRAPALFKKILLVVPVLVGIFTIADLIFNKWKIVSPISAWIIDQLNNIWTQITNQPLLSILIGIISVTIWSFWKRLSIVAGEFKDDFSAGLYKWEFGSEGWRIEKEKGEFVLSVSESQDGGITKKGFTWSDYEFSFETKIVKHNVGWIIRAENRNKYLMIQLHMEDVSNPKLRLHLRYPDYPWVVTEEKNISLDKPIKYLEWIKVRITVSGSNVDVYMNNQHCEHYFLYDPFVFRQVGNKKASEKTVVMNYAVGRVGFRCAPPNEHAHFKNVRVKPLLD